MKKLFSKKRGYVIIAAVLVISLLASYAMIDSRNSSAAKDEKKVMTAKERLQAKRNETLSSSLKVNEKEENEVVRVIVTLKSKSVAQGNRVSNYNSKLKSKEKNVINNQKSVIAKVEKLTGNKVIHQSGYLVNSFSINATRKQMRKIAKLDGVKKVSEAIKYKTTMATPVEEGNAKAQWESKDYGYTGEGVVVAVIDTGVNYKHKDMVLDKGAKTKYTKEQWKEKIKLLGYGNYFTEKVPFGYDYTKGKNEALTGGHEHGHHVSGIVAANGEVVGVARNAQIVGLKVLSDEGWGYSDDIVKAIEDATKLGVDVINMSLGYDRAVVSDYDFEQVAINNASKAGIICCISAGNSGTSAGYGDNSNLLNMKDTTTVGTPIIATSSLGVASAENIKYRTYCTGTFNVNNENMTMEYIDAFGYGFDFTDANMVNVGIAVDENRNNTFKAKKVKDKIAVVQRGVSSLNDKMYQLSKAGAKGIILVDENETIDNRIEFVDWYGVPVIVVNKTDGEKILAVALNSTSKMSLVSVDNSKKISTSVYMSYFSSWGPTNELGIKPEITAPGGKIKSTLGGEDGYSVASGTSMSSPFVAGSEAVMISAVRARGLNLKGENLSKFLKNSMMNTADVIMDPNSKYPYSVRYQGAGMVDVYGAVDNNVLATYNGEAKIELGELTGSKTVDITLTNYGKKAASYSLKESQIYTDNTENKNVGTKDEEHIYNIVPVEGAKITYNVNQVTVPAGGKVTVKATVNLPSTYNKNSYVEAFVLFEGNGVQSIGMPVLGFNGNWSEEAIIDKSAYEEGNSVIENAGRGLESLTSLVGYNDETGVDSILGAELYKVKENNNTDVEVNSTDKKAQVKRITKNAIVNGFYDGKKIDKSKAIEANVGDTKELPIINGSDSVLYKLSNKKKTGCKVNIDHEIYPVVSIYDKNLNLINTNLFGYLFGICYDLEFSMPKNQEVYVEVFSLDGNAGMYEVEFEKIDYNEENDFVKMAKENAKNNKNYILKENKTVNIKNNDSGFLSAEFTPKKDGYYTFDLETPSACKVTLYEYVFDENGDIIESNELDTFNGFKKISREFKLNKGSKYSLDISANNLGCGEKDTLVKIKVRNTSGENVYSLEYKFNGENVAFSPNDDGIRDSIAVALAIIRNAKEVSMKVLDANKNVIRTIANSVDVAKLSYGEVESYGANFLVNAVTGEPLCWDGQVYNKKTGEYEKAKEGQYYIQVESKISEKTSPQVITMPVKIDNVEPTISKFEVSKVKKDTIVTFNINDDKALSPYYYVDVEQDLEYTEEEFEDSWWNSSMTFAKSYVETEKNADGDYVINLGNIDDSTVTMMLEDEAGNEITKEINGTDSDDEDEDEDVDVDLEDCDEDMDVFQLCEGVYLDNKLEEDGCIFAYEDTATIMGECIKGTEVTVEGCKTEYEDAEGWGNFENSNFFTIEVPVGVDDTTLTLPIAVISNGKEVFNKTYNLTIDRVRPTMDIIYDNNDIKNIKKFQKDMIQIALLNKKDGEEVSFKVKAEDNNLDESTFNIGAYAISEDAEEDVTCDSEYLGDGVFLVKTVLQKGGIHIAIDVADKASTFTYKELYLYTNENVEAYNEQVNSFKQFINMELFDGLSLEREDLNEDGTYTVAGELGSVPDKFLINGERVEVNPKTKSFEHNIKIKRGCNVIRTELTIDGETITDNYRVYYDEIKVKFNNLPKANAKGVITTNKEILNLSGVISSYVTVSSIDINGDNVFTTTSGKTTDVERPITKKFNYNIKLEKGKNIITFNVATAYGHAETKILTVIISS